MNEKSVSKTCYVFGAAPVDDYSCFPSHINEGDLVICADGGYAHAVACGITPHWLVGDFDSNQLPIQHPNVIRVKPEKDDTDMELAVRKGMELGYRDFIIYGALGGRFDHSIANVQMLAAMLRKGARGVVRDVQNEMFVIENDKICLYANDYPYVSLFSLSDRCTGITLTGMKYPLTDAQLTNVSAGLGVSNEILGQKGTIEVKHGMLLIIRSKDRCFK